MRADILAASRCDGNYVTYTLDAVGNQLAEKRGNGTSAPTYSVTKNFNAVDKPVQTLDAQGRTTLYAYDGDRNPIQKTDPLGIVTQTHFDARGRVTATIGNSNGADTSTRNATATYAYDAADHLVKVVDPDNLMTSYAVDPLGHVLQLSSPDTGTSANVYDSAGRQTVGTDARGISVTYGYDALNRVTTASYVDASQNVVYHYDDPNSVTGCSASFPTGHLTRIVEGAGGGTIYCYDQRGNITVKTQTLASGATDSTQYFYSMGDRLAQITYPSGNTALYARDAIGHIANIDLSGTAAYAISPGTGSTSRASSSAMVGVTGDVIRNVQYLPFGPISSYVLGGDYITFEYAYFGQKVSRTYDGNYWLTGVSSATTNLNFTRNAVGEITGVTGAATDTTKGAFNYDPLYRLKDQQVLSRFGVPLSTESYVYNPTGDRTSKTSGHSTATNYTYAANTHHLMSVGNAARTYDAMGNTLTSVSGGETYGFTYNARGRLGNVQRNGQSVADYAYNALGQRISKDSTYPIASSHQRFVYDESGHLLGEYGDQVREYVWLDDVPVAAVDISGATRTVNYIVSDGLGTPRTVINKVGTVLWQWPYMGNAFGEGQPTSSGYTLNLRFPGQYFDSESGLAYNVNRDYEAATGRYVQSDPIGLNGGLTTFSYTEGNPLNGVDPQGLACNALGCWNTPAERGYAQAGNYSLYYQSACAGGDKYACRAGEVAANADLPGLKGFLTKQTNRNLVDALQWKRPPMQCDQIDSYIDEHMENIRKGLALARMHSLDGATPDNPSMVPRKTISDFHHQVFQDNGADPGTFGGDKWDAIHGAFFTNYDWCPAPSCRP